MHVPPFKMSESTKHKFQAAFQGLEQVHQAQILNVVADLCAEVEVHCTVKAMEEIRQTWANTLAVMLRVGS